MKPSETEEDNDEVKTEGESIEANDVGEDEILKNLESDKLDERCDEKYL